MLESRGHLDFPLEPVGTDAGGDLGRQDFDDHFAPQRLLFGDEDPRHPAAAEFALQRVGGAEGVLQIVAQCHRRPVSGEVECRLRWSAV